GFLDRLQQDEANLDSGKLALLRRPVESRMAKLGVLQSQAEMDKLTTSAKNKAQTNVTRDALEQQNKQNPVAQLRASSNKAYRDAKYKEAYQLAATAHEMDLDNPIASTAMMMSKTMIRKAASDALKDEKDKFALEALVDAERFGDVVNTADPLKF